MGYARWYEAETENPGWSLRFWFILTIRKSKNIIPDVSNN